MELRYLKEEDIPILAKLESEIFSDCWSEKSLSDAVLNENYKMLGSFKGEELCGYIILIFTADEAELARIATVPKYRKQGIGAKIMEKACELCEKGDIKEFFLEVREQNEAAQRLYKKFGFAVCGKRKGYYNNPTDNAVLMKKEM